MPAILDIRSLLKSRRQERAGDVFDMARRLARNESIDPDELLAALTAAGINDAALADLVDMLTRRDEYRAKAATLPAAQKELAAVRDGIKRQREALDEAERRYRRAVEPLIEQESAAEVRVNEATSAASALMAPRNLPAAIVARAEEAREALNDAGSAVREIESEIARQKRRAEDGLAVLEREGGFDKWDSLYSQPDRRQYMSAAVVAAVENVRGGRHRAADGAKRLEEAIAARQAAEAAYHAAEKAAREF
jgi:hypothetical protein